MALVRNIVKTLVTHPVKSFTTGLKALVTHKAPPNVISNVVPFSPAGKVVATGKILSKTRGLATKGYNLLKSELLPTAKDSSLTIAKKIGKSYLGLSLGQSVVAGKPQLAGGRALGSIVGLATSPVSFGVGVAESSAGKFFDLLNSYKKSGNIKMPNYENIPTWQPDSIPKKLTVDLSGMPQYQNPSFIMSLPEYSTPSLQSPSFSPSISVGGGGGEILPLLLLMGAGLGVGGYMLGKRRKRKKKKYKKKK